MTTYQGIAGGPRDPATPGPYCLTRCLCGDCPQYAQQDHDREALRQIEYAQRRRRNGWRRHHSPDPDRTARPDTDDQEAATQ